MNNKKAMGKTVKGILDAAYYVWRMVEDIDDVVRLVQSAKMICNLYNLMEMADVLEFEDMIVAEWKYDKAREAEQELRDRFAECCV